MHGAVGAVEVEAEATVEPSLGVSEEEGAVQVSAFGCEQACANLAAQAVAGAHDLDLAVIGYGLYFECRGDVSCAS